MPAEHGGWAFLGEPVLLGLLVAPSVAGVLWVLAAVAAFLTRQPLRLAVGDRRRGERHPHTVQAERAFVVLMLVAGACGAAAAFVRPIGVWPGFVFGLPLAAMAIGADLSLRSRELLSELAGALALACLATIVAQAGGWSAMPALALAGILAARIVPSVLYVRARLRLERGERIAPLAVMIAHAVAILAVAGLVSRGLAPRLTLAIMVTLAGRAALGLSRWRPRFTAPALGVSEVVYGLLVVLATVFGR